MSQISLKEELSFVAGEFRRWIEANCPGRDALRDYCTRWHTTPMALERFLNGEAAALDAATLLTVSRDTGISLERLLFLSKAVAESGGTVELKPLVIGNEGDHPAKLMTLADIYDDRDFKGEEVWIRSTEALELRPSTRNITLLNTGLKLIEHQDYFIDFMPALGRNIFGRVQVRGRGELLIFCLNFSEKCVIIGENQRVGIMRIAPKQKVVNYVYRVPSSYVASAKQV